jgi:hypothetical protein
MEKGHLKRKPSCDNRLEHVKQLLKHYQFASSFEQWNFINNGSSKGRKNENLIYYAFFVIFQRYKIIVLSSRDTILSSF